MRLHRFVLALALGLPTVGFAADKDAGFAPLFNGKDLTGWVNVNCHPETFFVKNGEIITTGRPTGFLRTDRQYENFILEFEWMHVEKTKMANSGLFVWGDPIPAQGSGYTRGIEVQVLINYKPSDGWATSHGDLFSIWGARCKPDRPHPRGIERCLPSEERVKGAGEWNHYKVIANNGAIKLHVNGKEVSGVAECNPRKGYLALESEGSECHFRDIKIKELPSTNPKPSEIADEAKGFKNIYTGLDLSNFQRDPDHEGHWIPSDWRLKYDGKSQAQPGSLYLDKEFGDYELVVDWMLPAKKSKDNSPRRAALILRERIDYMLTATFDTNGRLIIAEDSDDASRFLLDEKVDLLPLGKFNRVKAMIKGDQLTLSINGKAVADCMVLKKLPNTGEIALMDTGTEMEFANIFLRELK
jgi:hypothetical protein